MRNDERDHPERYKFLVDPTVKRKGRGGPVPSGDPRRCRSANSVGLQCGRWALRGAYFCKRHGGYRRLGMSKLPNYLASKAGPTLRKKLEEFGKMSDDERMSLSAEIDAVRALAEKCMSEYSEIVIDGRDDHLYPDAKDLGDLKRHKEDAAKKLRDALREVSGFAIAKAKVDNLRKNNMPVENAEWLTYNIMKLIHEVIEPVNEKLAHDFAKKIETIRLTDSPNEKIIKIS